MVARNKHRLAGFSLALLGGAFSSIAPAVVKVGISSQVDPIPLLVYRFLLSVLVFWIITPIFSPQYLKISWPALGSCALVALSNTISLYVFYLAVARIDASLVMMIFSFYPLAALIFLSMHGERIRLMDWLSILFGLTGIYLLLGQGDNLDWIGIILALFIPIFYALHLVLIQWRLADTPSQTVALYTVTLMAVFITAIGLVFGQVGGSLQPIGWVVVALTALVSTVLARLATFTGVRMIGSGRVALLGPIEILLGILWAFILLGERLTPIQWGGGVLIVASATLVLTARKSAPDLEKRVDG
jgi:drug/metabolite transporter (DMT)-like permease